MKKTIREITEDITMDMINIQNGLLDKLLNEYNSVKEEKENLSMELNEYKNLGFLEELKEAKKYIDLAKKHGTIGKVIEACADYEAIGTVEECREAVEKTKEKKCVKDSCPDYVHYKCPTCGKIQKTKYNNGTYGCILNNCSNCGQKLEEED